MPFEAFVSSGNQEEIFEGLPRYSVFPLPETASENDIAIVGHAEPDKFPNGHYMIFGPVGFKYWRQA